MPIQLSGSGSITGVSTFSGPITSLDVSGNVSVGGTLTYEDVTSIDAVGVITARNGLHVTSGSVGIGTENPATKLNVVGNTRVEGFSNAKIQIKRTGNTVANGSIEFLGSDNSFGWGLIANYDAGGSNFNIKEGSDSRLYIKSGNIGINETNPSTPLHVAGSLTLENSSATGNAWTYYKNADRTWLVGIRGSSSDALSFYDLTNGTDTERMRISSDGNVGVGDDNPSVPFNVKAGGASFAGQTTHVKIEDTTSLAANVGGLLAFEGVYNTNGDPACYAMIHGGKTNADNGNYAGYLRFFTRPSGALPQERLRIKSDGKAYFTGNLGLGGQTSPASTIHINDLSANGYELKVTGNALQFNRTSNSYIDQLNDTGKILFRMTSSHTEAMRITSDGKIGINDSDPRTGLTITKYGTAPTTNANTYSYPAGRWVSTWNTSTANNTDYWAGFGGGGYAVSSGSVNIALATNHNNTSQQAGMYIAGEATSLTSADFTIGKIVSGSAIGSSDVAGNQRATKSELMRVTGDGKVGINNTDPQTTLNVQGTISTGRNLAREVGTVISYSSSHDSSRSGGNVINGKKNYENGNNDWLTQGNNRDNAWVVIDLGAQYDIDRVVIYNQNEYSDSRREVKRFNLEGSNDNSSWTLLIDDELGRSDAHEPNPGFSFRLPHVSSPGGMHDDHEGATYRYWKFHMKDFHGSDPYGGIMEIELYGASDAVDSEVSTHSVVASDVYTQTLSAKRLAIGENGALGDFRANQNENVYINAAARFGQNTQSSSGNASRHTGWRMYGYCPDGINNRLQYTMDGLYMRKSFYFYFPNGVANQAIRFHSNRNSFWSAGYVTIHSTYSHQNASGLLRYNFRYNRNGGSNYGSSVDVETNIGNTSGNFGMSNSYTFKGWASNTGGTNTGGGAAHSHAFELRHLTSTGNGCWVTWELYGSEVHSYADDLYMTTGYTY